MDRVFFNRGYEMGTLTRNELLMTEFLPINSKSWHSFRIGSALDKTFPNCTSELMILSYIALSFKSYSGRKLYYLEKQN